VIVQDPSLPWISVRQQSRHVARRFLASLLLVLLLATLAQSGAARAAGPELVIRELSQDEGGVITAHVAADGVDITALRVFVDDIPANFQVVNTNLVPTRVVLAIENSVSMTTANRAEIQLAAESFLSALSPGSEVALVTYGNEVSVDVPFTTETASITETIATFEPIGGAALFSAVTTAADLLGESEHPALIVLVTYGWDWGGVSTAGYDGAS
jgi:hypothetical protein